jgi:hypothetical protein
VSGQETEEGQRSKWRRSVAVFVGTLLFGTFLSVGLSAWITERTKPWGPGAWLFVLGVTAGIHLFFVGIVVLLRENPIEDFVKLVIFLVLAFLLLAALRRAHISVEFCPIAVASAALMGGIANLTIRRIWEN